jgi:hypothetical protein
MAIIIVFFVTVFLVGASVLLVKGGISLLQSNSTVKKLAGLVLVGIGAYIGFQGVMLFLDSIGEFS